jgi:hypothetical protein
MQAAPGRAADRLTTAEGLSLEGGAARGRGIGDSGGAGGGFWREGTTNDAYVVEEQLKEGGKDRRSRQPSGHSSRRKKAVILPGVLHSSVDKE